MKHIGDITKINGADLEPVDVVTAGSPCQGLSVAGKRKGLADERSGLFLEQMRAIKEMRAEDERNGRTDEFIRPRYLVWENVPGALSSGVYKGADFQCVLEEIAKVAQEDAVIPQNRGGWSNSGCILGDGWSIAWRIFDSQFWGTSQRFGERVHLRGTPQRRRRIALVADFGGRSAPEILFVRKGLSRDTKPSLEKGQGTSADTEDSIGETSGGIEPASTRGRTSYGFDQGTDRDVGKLFLKECAKTMVNGTNPGYHNAVCIEDYE